MLLRAEDITKVFHRNEKILKGVTLEIKEKSFTVMLGPSGSGKSTLLNVLSGMLKPTAGQVWFEGKSITQMKEKEVSKWKREAIGNIFQNYLLLDNLTVKENIEVGLREDTKGAEEKGLSFNELVQFLEIENLLNKFPAELSGGQQQRVAIARAVIKKPRLLFCDEATGALDEANSKKVVALLHRLCQQYGITVLFVTHNSQIARTADRVITIKDGQIYKDITNTHPITADEMIWE